MSERRYNRPANRRKPLEAIYFDIWGCRGSRSFLPARSAIGNNTSCYSVLAGERLLVFDAGWGLPALGYAMEKERRFRRVRSIDLLVSHAHCDHWEGLKDVGWLWQRNNGLRLRVWGTAEALHSIQQGFAHPTYVPIEVLAMGTLGSLDWQPVRPGERHETGDWRVRVFGLNHHSGEGATLRRLDTVGYRLEAPGGGPKVCYLLDHEPTEATLAGEIEVVVGSDLTVYDAHFADRADQRYGHGSQEHAASMASRNPGGLVFAGHHGPMYRDAVIRQNFRRHARGRPNFRMALEGDSYAWSASRRTFEKRGELSGQRRVTARSRA